MAHGCWIFGSTPKGCGLDNQDVARLFSEIADLLREPRGMGTKKEQLTLRALEERRAR